MMTPVVIALPDALKAFLDAEVVRTGCAGPGAYVAALLEAARAKGIAARLEPLVLAGLEGEALPLARAFDDGSSDAPNLGFVSAAARDDVQAACGRLLARGLPAIAERFHRAVGGAIDAAAALAGSGEACTFAVPALAGLRSWPVKGFSEQRLYGLRQDRGLFELRVLHDRRDIAPDPRTTQAH